MLSMYCDLYVFFKFTFTLHTLRCTVVCFCNVRLYVLCSAGGHKEKGGGSVSAVGSHDGTVGITESGHLTVSWCS